MVMTLPHNPSAPLYGVGAIAADNGLMADPSAWLDMARTDTSHLADAITLKNFMRDAWHVVQPATPFSDGWHIDAIAEHLEAVTNGDIRDLLINMPPRHMKSLCVGVFWPVWSWLREPHTQWLFSSYAATLSTRDAVKSRRLIDSNWFQRKYGHIFRLTNDQNTKTRYDNNRTGYRIATSVQGSATGEGGDIVVVDDPHKASEGGSEKKRTSVLEWWDETMASRLNDQRTGRRVIVMQRVHEADLSGHVLEQGGYEHLMLPAEFDSRRRTFTSIGWSDPRTHDGQLLWPNRVGPKEIATLKVRLGSYGYAGQYQQAPVPRGGGMFLREWWQYWHVLPRMQRVIVTLDAAQKEGIANDYAVLAVWGEGVDGYFYLMDLWRDKAEIGKLLRAIHAMYYKWKDGAPIDFAVVAEDKSHGTTAIQTMRRPYYLTNDDGTPGGVVTYERGVQVVKPYPAISIGPFPRSTSVVEKELAPLSKDARAEAVVPLIENARVFLPMAAPWLQDFIDEHAHFPFGQHDDQVDTTAIALIRLFLGKPKRQQAAPRSGGSTSYS